MKLAGILLGLVVATYAPGAATPTALAPKYELIVETKIYHGVRATFTSDYWYNSVDANGVRTELWQLHATERYMKHWISDDGTVWVLANHSKHGGPMRGFWSGDPGGAMRLWWLPGDVFHPKDGRFELIEDVAAKNVSVEKGEPARLRVTDTATKESRVLIYAKRKGNDTLGQVE